MPTSSPLKSSTPSSPRRTSRYWSKLEDDLLLELVDKYGARSWIQISDEIRSRSPKQCHERYTQNLRPGLRRDHITPEEAEFIEKQVKNTDKGRKWAAIARKLGGRSGNMVKNWWYTTGAGRDLKYKQKTKDLEGEKQDVQDTTTTGHWEKYSQNTEHRTRDPQHVQHTTGNRHCETYKQNIEYREREIQYVQDATGNGHCETIKQNIEYREREVQDVRDRRMDVSFLTL
jgi:hypothetical protein